MTALPPHIAHLVQSVEESLHSGTPLTEALAGELDLTSFLGSARFAEGRYERVPLYQSAQFEVRLLCWSPGQSSALHHHGRSACAFRVLAGEATEFRLTEPDRVLKPGAIGHVPLRVIHQISNLASSPLVTLHVYSPPLPADQPALEEGHRVAVLGGGFSGVAAAVHLLSTGAADLRISIVERTSGELGRGVAYGTEDPAHILNVVAEGMSLDPAAPNEFLEYAKARGVEAHGRSLLSRRLYGDYVLERLTRAIEGNPGRLRLVRGEAVSLRREGERWRVGIHDGRELPADDVVLATGHGPTPVPAPLSAFVGDPRLVLDPWPRSAISNIAREARVLLVGTGLTAIDVLSSLRGQGHTGPIVAVSRHGLWPRPHLPTVEWLGRAYPVDPATAPTTAAELAAWVLQHIGLAEQQKLPWQAVINSIRPHIPSLWGRLPEAERSAFLTQFRPLWEVTRHRVSLPLHEALGRWQEEGWLKTSAGLIAGAKSDGAELLVEIETPAGAHQVRADHVILCTGAESDVRRFDSRLWRDLVSRGEFVLPDPLGLGILTAEDGAVLGPRGVTPRLWAIGGLLRPKHFESTAVPSLAPQAKATARRIRP